MSIDRGAFHSGLSHQLQDEVDTVSGGHGNNKNAAVFWIGIVMDDKDDLMMGRVWVYLAGYNQRGPDETLFPTWKGTAPDKRGDPDTNYSPTLRQNWILCYPNSGFFGSDEFRADFTNDGRNSFGGDVNAYGDFIQPRIGDHVSVIMMNGDPSLAYWTGCLPKLNQNNMVPGMPGTPKAQIDTGSITQGTGDGAMLHGYDNKAIPMLPNDSGDVEGISQISPQTQVAPGSVNTSPTPVQTTTDLSAGLTQSVIPPVGTPQISATPNRFPANSASRNAVVGGHAYDQQRGPGSSSARRESPSYVTGRKSAGWVFDTEQFNANALGSGRFGDQTQKYRYTNTTGHQFVMDDHPDSQLVRLRTSAGSQLLFNDSGTVPYVYISTSKGNVFLEFADDGNMHFYSEDSMNFHSKKDMNFTADRAINFECTDMNVYVHDTYRETVSGNKDVSINGGLSQMVLGGLNFYVQGGASTTVQGPYGLIVTGDISLKGANYSDCISGTHISDVNGSRYQMAGGLQSIQASSIWLNSGLTAQHKEPKSTVLPKFPELTKKPGVPTNADIQLNQRADKDKYLGNKVPQHQPWPGRTGVNTAQTNGAVGSTPSGTGSALATPNLGGSVGTVTADPTTNSRNGAALPTATVPDTVIGECTLANPQGNNSINFTGLSYADTLAYLGGL